MKHTRVKFTRGLAGMLFAAFFVCTGAGAAGMLTASADDTPAQGADLFLPSAYEQYLELKKPEQIAFSERYIAIVDGSTLFLFDREENAYTETILSRNVTQIGFSGDRLFLSDRVAGNLGFYEYNYASNSLDQVPDIDCSTFCIDGDTLYTAIVGGQETSIGAYSISELGTGVAVKDLGTVRSNVTPNMTTLGGVLYCAFEDRVYREKDGKMDANSSWLAEDPSKAVGVQAVCAQGDALYYTASEGLYRADFGNGSTLLSTLLIESDGLASLASFGNFLYVVQGDSVRQVAISKDGAAFTDYEITSSSDSVFRLSSAVETVRAGNLLVTADAGNRRVTVYNFATGEYSEIRLPESAVDFVPALVATDGDLIAVASEYVVYTCHYGETEFTYRGRMQSNVRGLACVYGKVYYVTANAYGQLDGEEVYHDLYGTPSALAADVYGDLYVVYEGNSVTRFTESSFLTGRAAGEVLGFKLPAGYTSLRADFEGNLYCLVGASLYRNGEEEPLITLLGTDFVHTTSAGLPVSFALGFEDSEVFFLYGDYIVRTLRGTLDIPTLDEIDAEGVREEVFAEHGKDSLLIDIPAGTIGIRTDLAKLREEDPPYFPYSFYFRTNEDLRGVLLAEKNGYALVVLYEMYEDDRVFTANLFRLPETHDSLVDESEYWTEGGKQQYISSDVSSYFFPCLPDALKDVTLTRGTRVNVLGTVAAFERDYCLVEYETAARSISRGFVPAAYLTDVNPNSNGGEDYLLGTLKKQKEDEGVLFTADDGDELLLTGGEQLRLYDNGDGTYTARITKEGKIYSAQVTESMINWGESDALRIALIIILSVIALLIIAVYTYFLPWDRKKKKQ